MLARVHSPGKHEGVEGITEGVQTPATLVVDVAKATCNRNALNPGNRRCGCCKSHLQPQRPQRQQSAGAAGVNAGVNAGVTAGVGVRVSPHAARRSTDQSYYGGAATPPFRATHNHVQFARTGACMGMFLVFVCVCAALIFPKQKKAPEPHA